MISGLAAESSNSAAAAGSIATAVKLVGGQFDRHADSALPASCDSIFAAAPAMNYPPGNRGWPARVCAPPWIPEKADVREIPYIDGARIRAQFIAGVVISPLLKISGKTMQDLKSYSLSDLKKLCVQIEKEIEKRATGAKKALIRKLEKMAQAEGLELSDLLDGAPARKAPVKETKAKAPKATKATKPVKAKAEKQPAEKKEALPPVYFNPLNPKEGWSGRGRKPNWVINWLGNGGELDDLKKKRS